ncbi:uncharacterized protein ACNLHF_014917 isoform 1-T2 [Anomaloglossus baeobatrachus]
MTRSQRTDRRNELPRETGPGARPSRTRNNTPADLWSLSTYRTERLFPMHQEGIGRQSVYAFQEDQLPFSGPTGIRYIKSLMVNAFQGHLSLHQDKHKRNLTPLISARNIECFEHHRRILGALKGLGDPKFYIY